MSLQRSLVSSIVSLVVLALCTPASAQHLEKLARKHGDNSDFSGFYDPFGNLEADWFEPLDMENSQTLSSGWFFGYSRMNINISRPRNQPGTLTWDSGTGEVLSSIYSGGEPGDYDGDWAWGNRFDFGWVSEDGTGLWFVARKLDNPNQRLDFDSVDSNDDEINRFDGEPWGDSFIVLNGFNMWGFEANKVWRLAPTPRGAILEPFLGPRYIRLRDHADRNDIFASNPLDFFASTGPANTTTPAERLSFNFRQAVVTTDNDLFGGQLGLRSRWNCGRWHITSDVRGLAFWNHQMRESLANNEIQQQDFSAAYDANGNITGSPASIGGVLQRTSQENVYETNNTFVYGGELNLQAAFAVTNGFAVTFGTEVLAFADGIGRGYSGVDDSLVLAGFSIGFTVNR